MASISCTPYKILGGDIRLWITLDEDYDNTVSYEAELLKYIFTGSYIGIVINLVCATDRTVVPCATCWEIQMRNRKLNLDYAPAVLRLKDR